MPDQGEELQEYEGIPIGSARWDGTANDPSLNWYVSHFGIGGALFDRFVFRRPTAMAVAPNAPTNFSYFGVGVDTQAIVDQEIDDATGILDYWLFVSYPAPADIFPDTAEATLIRACFDAYMNSSKKNQIKFALLLSPFWLAYPGAWEHFVTQCNTIAALVQDPQYQRIYVPGSGPLPLVVLGFESVDMDIAHWNTFLSIVGPVYLAIGDGSVAAANTLGARAVFWYGPRLLPVGNGQHAFTEQQTIDEAAWVPTGGRDAFPCANVLQDRRVFMGTATAWADQSTQPQLVNDISAALNCKGALTALVHSWNEYAEGGPGMAPTFQEGDRYLRALTWLRTGVWDSRFTYEVSLYWKCCVRVGFTGYTQPIPGGSVGIPGNYNADEITSSTTSDSIELTHPWWEEFTLYVLVGPDRGIVAIHVNDVFVANVDLYAPVYAAHTAVYTGALDVTQPTQTVKFVVTGTKNAASSSVKIGLNTCEVTYGPAGP